MTQHAGQSRAPRRSWDDSVIDYVQLNKPDLVCLAMQNYPSDAIQTSSSDAMQTSSSDAMQISPPDVMQTSSSSGGVQSLLPLDERNLLEQGYDTGEHIRARSLRIDANRSLQNLTGPGRARASGKKKRKSGTRNSTSSGPLRPPIPSSTTISPTSYRSARTTTAHPSYLFAPTTHRKARSSSPSHTIRCTTVYCVSA